jgi:hypothetical protein
MHPATLSVLAVTMMICAASHVKGEVSPFGKTSTRFSENSNQRSGLGPKNTAPQGQPYYQYNRPSFSGQHYQYNPPGLSTTRQYNPPGLNGQQQGTNPNQYTPYQYNPPGLSGQQQGTNPNQYTPYQYNPPGLSGQQQGINPNQQYGQQQYNPPAIGGQPPQWDNQAPLGYQPAYQAQPAYSPQFMCRTRSYTCAVPYRGDCECRRDVNTLGERGTTID